MDSAVPGVGDVAEVRGQRAVIGRSGCFRVGIRFWKEVGQLPGTGEHLAALIGSIQDLKLKERKENEAASVRNGGPGVQIRGGPGGRGGQTRRGPGSPRARTHLLSEGFGFSLRVRNSDQVPEGDVVHTVTGGAHLLIHLVAAADAAGDTNSVTPGVTPIYVPACTGVQVATWGQRRNTCRDPGRRGGRRGSRGSSERGVPCRWL